MVNSTIPQTSYPRRWYVLAVLCIVLFIISIDNTVLNLAIPSISASLGASTSQLQWMVDAYTLVFASLLITTGALGDRFGRKKFLLIGLAIFGLGSAGAALSKTIQVLIGFRALLGMAGAVIMPSTLSLIISVFHDPRERAKAIAIWSSIFSIGAGIGPIIGGFLIHSFDWSAVFFLNVPIVLIGIIGGVITIPESRDPYAPPLDLPGVILSIVGLISLVYGMILAGEFGWLSQNVLISFAIAVVFLGGFIWWENHTPAPMLPLVFFKNRAFTGANIGLTISSFGMMGSMYFFSQFIQSIQGKSPIMSALYMLPMTPAVFLSTMASIRVDHKLGTKPTMCAGLIVTGVGLFLFSQMAGLNTPYWQVLLSIVILGVGIGFTVSPATNSVMSSLPPNRAGIGSAMNDTTRQLGGALGVAVLGALMNGTYRSGVSSLKSVDGVTASLFEHIQSSVQNAHLVSANLPAGTANLVVTTSSQAFVNGMSEALFFASLTLVLAAVGAWIFLPDREVKSAPVNKEPAEG